MTNAGITRASAVKTSVLAVTLLAACAAESTDHGVAPPPQSSPPARTVTLPAAASASLPRPAASASAPRDAPSAALDAGSAAADLVLADGPPTTWSGARGNALAAITGIWGTGDHVFAVGSGFILHSADRGLRWTRTPGPTGWVTVWGSSVDDVYVGGDATIRSVDRGTTWTATSRPRGSVASIWGSGPTDVYAVSDGASPLVSHTADHGETWTPVAVGLKASWLHAIAGSGPKVVWVAGTGEVHDPRSPIGYHTTALLARSADGGKTWKSVAVAKPGTTDNEEIRNLCFTASGMLVASYSYSVHGTVDEGRTWKQLVVPGTEVLGLACSGREILVGARNRTFRRSDDEGATWTSNDLDAVWSSDRALIALQAMFVSDSGQAYVGGEGGTLLRRAH
jgi:hypothetical protein